MKCWCGSVAIYISWASAALWPSSMFLLSPVSSWWPIMVWRHYPLSHHGVETWHECLCLVCAGVPLWRPWATAGAQTTSCVPTPSAASSWLTLALWRREATCIVSGTMRSTWPRTARSATTPSLGWVGGQCRFTFCKPGSGLPAARPS